MLWLFEREPLNLIPFVSHCAFHLNHHQSEIIIENFKDKIGWPLKETQTFSACCSRRFAFWSLWKFGSWICFAFARALETFWQFTLAQFWQDFPAGQKGQYSIIVSFVPPGVCPFVRYDQSPPRSTVCVYFPVSSVLSLTIFARFWGARFASPPPPCISAWSQNSCSCSNSNWEFDNCCSVILMSEADERASERCWDIYERTMLRYLQC